MHSFSSDNALATQYDDKVVEYSAFTDSNEAKIYRVQIYGVSL